MRFLSTPVFILLCISITAQSDSLGLVNNSLHIHYQKGKNPKTIVLEEGHRLKVDLKNGERKKGLIEEVQEDGVLLDGEKVFYTEISAIKNKGYSRSVGKGLMLAGGNGILLGGALAGMGALILDSAEPNFFTILIGVGAVGGGIIIAFYAGVVVLAGLITDLATKRVEVEHDKVIFEVLPSEISP